MIVSIQTGTIKAPSEEYSPKIMLIDYDSSEIQTDPIYNYKSNYYKLINLQDLRSEESTIDNEIGGNTAEISKAAKEIIKVLQNFNNIKYMYYSRYKKKGKGIDNTEHNEEITLYKFIDNDKLLNRVLPYDALFFIFAESLQDSNDAMIKKLLYNDEDSKQGQSGAEVLRDLKRISLFRLKGFDKDNFILGNDDKPVYRNPNCAILLHSTSNDKTTGGGSYPEVSMIAKKLNLYQNETIASTFNNWAGEQFSDVNGEPIEELGYTEGNQPFIKKRRIIYLVKNTSRFQVKGTYSTDPDTLISNSIKKIYIENKLKTDMNDFMFVNRDIGFIMSNSANVPQLGFDEITDKIVSLMIEFSELGFIAGINPQLHPTFTGTGDYAFRVNPSDANSQLLLGGIEANTYRAEISYLLSQPIEQVIIELNLQL